MSLIDQVRNLQGSGKSELEISTRKNMESMIKQAASLDEKSIVVNFMRGFSRGGSPERVAIFNVMDEIAKEEGFNKYSNFVGNAGSHRANGDHYIYGIKW